MSSLFRLSFVSTLVLFVAAPPVFANDNHELSHIDQLKNTPFESIIVGANIDLFAGARNFGPENEKKALRLREVEVSLEARINPWLYGMIFLTKPFDEAFEVEEAAVVAELSHGFRLKAGQYRHEFGLLNTIHEPERPQISLPLPVSEFLGDEQLREAGVTIGKTFTLAPGRIGGVSLAVLNNENKIAFNESQTKDLSYAAKVYYGHQSSAMAYQLGLSALTGKNDAAGDLRTNLQVFDFKLMLAPNYAPAYDYSSRFMLLGEVFYNHRELTTGTRNEALGYWAVADFQFMPAYHVGLGFESTEALLDQSLKSKAYSMRASWYYSAHGRFQVEARHLNRENADNGLEVLFQWNIVLAPHSEKPFLSVLE